MMLYKYTVALPKYSDARALPSECFTKLKATLSVSPKFTHDFFCYTAQIGFTWWLNHYGLTQIDWPFGLTLQ